MSEDYKDIYVTASDKKLKKGGEDGINSVLVLMKDTRDFQDKVEATLEAQTNPEQRAKIEAFYDDIEKMYQVLLDIASNGIKKVRKQDTQRTPVMLNVPTIPKI